jgi:predicted small secreted protein
MKMKKLFMHSNHVRCLVSKRTLLAAFALGSLLLSGCAHTGSAAGQAIPSANPDMYTYNPGTRDVESRWPFGPANYR